MIKRIWIPVFGSLSDTIENELIDHVFTAGYSAPGTVYIGLSTADVLDDASGNAEPVGSAYARVAVIVTAWTAAASRAINNNATITFPKATGAWGTITHYAIWDAASGETAGDLIAHGALNTSKAIVNDNTPSVASGEIIVSFNAGDISTYLANALLDHLLGGSAYSTPNATIHVALSTADPTDSGGSIAEPGGSNYARKPFTDWAAASGGATENSTDIVFNTPSGSWGLITYGAIMDALTSGNMLFYGTVTNQTPDNGDTVQYTAGDLDVSMT
jgi:hypothetical protein